MLCVFVHYTPLTKGEASGSTGCSPDLFSTLISSFYSRYFSFLLLGLAGKLVGAWHGMGMVAGRGNGIDFMHRMAVAFRNKPFELFSVCMCGLFVLRRAYIHAYS
jgi:hypothetical protein